MKTLKTSRALLVSSILTALAGCEIENPDYTPETQANNNAPTHGGDIVLAYHEKDAFKQVDLLGTITGISAGDTAAKDADGNFLTVTDIVITPSGDRVDDIAGAGVEVQGNKIGIRPLDIAPNLDTGETYTVAVNFNISDGQNKTPRMATFTFTGEDFAPVIVGDAIGNFTRDAGASSIDLLDGVTDADEEELMVSDLVISSDNPFNLPMAFNGTNLDLDIAAVEASIPDGEKVTFEFSYTVSDHNNDLTRQGVINVLGVQDVAGAPLVTNYFKELDVQETDSVQVIDLSNEIVEREGDEIVISEVMIDGEALPFGYELNGNVLTLDPHSFFNDVAAGQEISHTVTYKVADTAGNQSDGTPELSITISGVETNLIAAAMPNYDFEDPSLAGDIVAGGNLGGFSNIGWANWGCPEAAVGADFARTGTMGLRLRGSFCHLNIDSIIPSLPNDEKYAFSYGLYNNAVGTTPYVPIYASAGTELPNRFWAGARHVQTLNTWLEHVQVVNTFEFGNWVNYVGATLSWGILKYDDSYSGGSHNLDDFSVVAFGSYDAVAHDILEADVGAFEAGETITSTGGIVEVQSVTTGEGEAAVTANKLFVDTTNVDGSVTISLPIKAGAISQDGRYAVSLQAQLINHDDLYSEGANTRVPFSASLSNGTETISASLTGSTWGANVSSSDIIISESYGTSADVDWSQEDMVLNLTFSQDNAQYYIDNVRLIIIP
ncbi:MAG: hypothetical protein HWE10_14330 [Gammaproteobacteria bacterium]|nr:hypothetical protein [Gammaproteobacteria bacterium]